MVWLHVIARVPSNDTWAPHDIVRSTTEAPLDFTLYVTLSCFLKVPNTGKEVRFKIIRNIGTAFVRMGQFQVSVAAG